MFCFLHRIAKDVSSNSHHFGQKTVMALLFSCLLQIFSQSLRGETPKDLKKKRRLLISVDLKDLELVVKEKEKQLFIGLQQLNNSIGSLGEPRVFLFVPPLFTLLFILSYAFFSFFVLFVF